MLWQQPIIKVSNHHLEKKKKGIFFTQIVTVNVLTLSLKIVMFCNVIKLFYQKITVYTVSSTLLLWFIIPQAIMVIKPESFTAEVFSEHKALSTFKVTHL